MERKFIYGKTFGNGYEFRIYDILEENIGNYYELIFDEKFKGKFNDLKSAISEGENIFKTQFADKEHCDIYKI